MPRGPRLDVPGIPCHVIQRGNDRQACFFREADYVRYLHLLREVTHRHGCRVHAYVLMTNHVHLLLTPGTTGAIARTMQALGRNYVRYVNDTLVRTGTLWEGRYKSSLVDSDRYLLACYRYIELNPVRAGMAMAASKYRWSSHACNGYGHHDPVVSPHARYLELGITEEARLACYRLLVEEGIADAELTSIRLHAQRQRALGSDGFREQIERQLNRRAGIGVPGRPRKQRN
jgi:putative transposase